MFSKSVVVKQTVVKTLINIKFATVEPSQPILRTGQPDYYNAKIIHLTRVYNLISNQKFLIWF